MTRARVGAWRLLWLLPGLLLMPASLAAGSEADGFELTMELHTRWNEVVVFHIPVIEGRPFYSEEASGMSRHVVVGTLGAAEDGAYPVTLQLSRWSDQQLNSLQVVTLRVMPSRRWLGTTGQFSGDQVLAVMLAPRRHAQEGTLDGQTAHAN